MKVETYIRLKITPNIILIFRVNLQWPGDDSVIVSIAVLVIYRPH